MTIFFDFDDTLAFRKGKFGKAIYEILIDNQIFSISQEDIRPHLQNGFPWHSPEKSHQEIFGCQTWNEYMEELFYNVFRKLGIDPNYAIKFSQMVILQYLKVEYWELFPDVVPFLERLLTSKTNCYILSNHVPQLEDLVRNLNIHPYFKKIFTSGRMGFEKPNRCFFKFVLEELDIDTSAIIMIGDSYNADIIGAKKMGIKSILVRSENINNYKFWAKDFNYIDELLNIV